MKNTDIELPVLNWSDCQPEPGDFDPALAAIALNAINNNFDYTSTETAKEE